VQLLECEALSRGIIRQSAYLLAEITYRKNQESGESRLFLAALARGGCNAPYWTKNRQWIEEHVKEPLDYIQIDYERWRLNAMEWGINTAELQNLRHLTPQVFRADIKSDWCIKYDADFPVNDATLANAKYCLDRTITVILKQQEHRRTSRSRSREQRFDPPSIYLGDNVYKAASVTSDVVHVVSEGFEYNISEVVSGFNPAEVFFRITATSEERDANDWPKIWVAGFLLVRESENG
jgi:hypothetical protein